MTLFVRQAKPADAAAMTELLNRIIAIGGTTAHQTPFSEARMLAHYIAHPEAICCPVALDGDQLLGFQSLVRIAAPDPTRPGNWGSIGTFARAGLQGRGTGRALFAATRAAAVGAGLRHIDATIRADNVPGLGFYGRMGFVEYDRLTGVPLELGGEMDRIRKRFDL